MVPLYQNLTYITSFKSIGLNLSRTTSSQKPAGNRWWEKQMKTGQFEKKTVLITDGTKGIGKACTMDFTSLGARAICTYSNDDKAVDLNFLTSFVRSLTRLNAEAATDKSTHGKAR